MDFLQAVNSGHRGSLAVLHASSPSDAVARLETLALYAGLNLPVSAIRKQIASGLDIIVQQEQMHDGTRKITHITEVRDMEDDLVDLQDLFRYEIESTDKDGKVNGKFLQPGVPEDLGKFARLGVIIPPEVFGSSGNG